LASRLAAFALAICAVASVAAADVLAPFQETPVITGLTNPTAVRFAPDGRIFVAEQSGLLKVYNGLSDATPDVAADLRNEVMNNWDRGFLGLAIDPQFPAAGHDYVYVLYTVDAPIGQDPPVWNDACADQLGNGCPTRGRLSRLEIGPDNKVIGPEHILIDDRWCFQFVTHSVGDLHFGPEGALYVSAGEGANYVFTDYGQAGNPCGDPPNEGGSLRSQDILTHADPQSWDGSLLRLDVSGSLPVPWPSNPTAGGPTSDDDAIVAHGFRNPYRFTIHPGPGPQAGEVWVGDVGEATWEEINRIPSPNGPLLNFGWPCWEGGAGVSLAKPNFQQAHLPLCDGLYNGTIQSNVTPAFWAYNHNAQVVDGEQCIAAGTASITGMAFYQNGTYPAEYQGALFFQDYTRRCLWAMLPDSPGGVPNPNNRRSINWNEPSGSVDLEVGPGGDLYYAAYSGGQIIRLQYFSTNHPPVAALTATPSNGASPLSVAFDASGSTDVDPGETLTYSWDLNGDGVFGDTSDPDPRFAHFTYTKAGPVTISVRVTDSHGASSAASQIVTVANSPPVATILTPPSTLLWRVGDPIAFSGRGDDPEDGQLPASALSWHTILHHCSAALECHIHNLEGFDGVDHGTMVAPDHPYPSYLELQLTATDSGIGGWYNSAWSVRRRIALNNSAQTEDLVGFPVLVKLDASSVDYTKTQSAGQDLRFVDSTGTLLPHQIEVWDETGTSYVWVRVPLIHTASIDSIFMYYGNPSAPDAQNPTAVWDSTYAGVYHLGSSVTDSTPHANNGTDNGTTLVPGQIGSARFFNGTTWVEVPSSPSLALNATGTLEAWVKIANPTLNDPTRILDKKFHYDDPEGYDLEYYPSNNYVTVLGSGGDWGRADAVTLDTQWHWLSATISGITARVYVDGVDRTTDPQVSPLVAGTLALNIGRNPGGSYFQGAIDELRISNVARSPGWMRAQYLSMTGAFTTIGPEEGSGALSNTTSVSIYPETKNLSLVTAPPGLQVTLSNYGTSTAPFTQTVITNSTSSISVASPQPLGGVDQLFANWSDGGAVSHEIIATPSLPPITATFVSALCGNGVLDAGEDCDDHNNVNGDCCSALCHFEATGSTCSDGNACTTGDTCSAGTCVGGPAAVCNDGNACTADSCNPATGCVFNPTPLNGTSCNDGNACTTADRCNAGACVGGGTVVCNDFNGCTLDTCNPASGCVFDPAPLEGASCNDSQICTIGDVCSAGVCSGSPAPDGDGDGKCNPADNCPYVSNPGQQDSGGITLLVPDGIGDACQCGDLTGEGVVDEGDVLAYRNHLANPIGLPFVGAAALKCNVAGGDPAACNLLDVVITRRALLGAGPGIAQVCTAALPH
jgi:cysteine-rich repeat protein